MRGLTSYSSWLQKIYLINSWLLGEEDKPIIIRDADKTLHFALPRTIYYLTTFKKRFIPWNFHPVECLKLFNWGAACLTGI